MSAELDELKDIGFSALVGLKNDTLAGWYNQEKGELTDGFPVSSEDVVLDVGCGIGGMATFCAQRGSQIILIDSNPANLGQARARLARYHGLRLETHVSDAHRLPLTSESVSRVICTEVLEHVDDPTAVMAELFRVGRPGALYLITVPGTAQEMLQKRLAHPSYFEKPNHVRIFEPQSFAALVQGSGLTIEHTMSQGFFWSIWMALFWQANVPLSNASSHPSLDFWARTWAEVLKSEQARHVQTVLDEFLPKSQVIVARKPHQVTRTDGVPSFFEATQHLRDGDKCDEQVRDRLTVEIGRRLECAQVKSHPRLPQVTDLRMRREGLPDWWTAGNNVLLASPKSKTPTLRAGFFELPLPRNVILVVGEEAAINHVNVAGEGGLVVLGDKVQIQSGAMSAIGYCTILIGERTGATMWAEVDARNGGVVSVGADGMWAIGVRLYTDDSHAIRDVATGKRINKMGGVIILESHVWLCRDAEVMGDCHVGADSVVGMGSLVKDAELPANTVSVGRPARVVRTGTTWSRLDLP
ncbi:MAG TPA: methyltransferase domain-containing protein [Steroidobacteraceae bacterium]|jgi:SAM-dependent methyltransferase/acetyltransferase-like isoleucine patch superfamily enzyme|nr:methyltransferase domain-containing protein [Steroidobacteraceae bacterium]